MHREKDDLFWELIDKSLNRLDAREGLKSAGYEGYLDSLDSLTRKAVILGNLYYAMTDNTGTRSWFDDEYDEEADELFTLLREMDTPASKVIEDQLEGLLIFKRTEPGEIPSDLYEDADEQIMKVVEEFYDDVNEYLKREAEDEVEGETDSEM